MGHQEPPEVLLRLRLIGSVEAVDFSGKSVLPSSRKTQALLCYLALNAGQWVSRARITRLLWDRVPEEQGRASLRRSLHELSRAMGPTFPKVMETERERLRLWSETVWVDALMVAALADGAQLVDVPDINVFSGSLLLPSFDNLSDEFDHWLVAERQKLGERIRRLNETVHTKLQEVYGDHRRVEVARRAVGINPTNEEAVRELMRALVSSGQRAQAEREYERCRAALRSRLGLEPAHETQQLYRDLRRETSVEQERSKRLPQSVQAQLRRLNRGIRAVLLVDVVDSVRMIATD